MPVVEAVEFAERRRMDSESSPSDTDSSEKKKSKTKNKKDKSKKSDKKVLCYRSADKYRSNVL